MRERAAPCESEPSILDLRPAAAFAAGHLPGAFSWPLEDRADWPAHTRDDLVYLAEHLPSPLLPPKERPLRIVASRLATAHRVGRALAARGRTRLEAVSLGPDGDPGLRRRAMQVGPSCGWLWRPPPFLVRWSCYLPPPVRGGVVDLACGAGRSAVWLALRGYRVRAVDRDPGALERTRRLADAAGVSIDLVRSDLRRGFDAAAGGIWAAVTAFHWLGREIFTRLGDHVIPGGVVFAQTFRDAPGWRGPPHERHRLGSGEWTRLLAAPAWELLVHDEGHDARGLPVAGVVARRRPVCPSR